MVNEYGRELPDHYTATVITCVGQLLVKFSLFSFSQIHNLVANWNKTDSNWVKSKKLFTVILRYVFF